jgi:hypothetical protein
MANKPPSSIKQLFANDFPSQSWHRYESDDGKEIFLLIRRNSDGYYSWGIYINEAGTRKPLRTSMLHPTPDDADLEWFQSRIKLGYSE